MTKRWLSVLIVAVLALSAFGGLVGCDKSDTEQSKGLTGKKDPTAEPAQAGQNGHKGGIAPPGLTPDGK